LLLVLGVWVVVELFIIVVVQALINIEAAAVVRRAPRDIQTI
jgi:hypothetical protein